MSRVSSSRAQFASTPYSEPEPDLLVLRPRADRYRASHPSAADVLLLVEVSDTSLTYDRGRKLGLYANSSVPEVWIVDIAGSALEVCRDPLDGVYKSVKQWSSGVVSPLLVPGISVDVGALFV